MIHTAIEEVLPVAIKSIDGMISYETKLKLKSNIYTIMSLLKETSHLPYDDLTKTTAENFVTYLTKVCRSTQKVSSWGRWLETYSNIVITRLISLKSRNTILSPDPHNSVHQEFMVLIMDLVNSIKEFHVSNPNWLTSSFESIFDLLDNILLGAFNISSYDNYVYCTKIKNDIISLKDFVDATKYVQSNFHCEDVEMKIINSLVRLDWLIKHPEKMLYRKTMVN